MDGKQRIQRQPEQLQQQSVNKICIAALSSSPRLSPASPPTRGAAGLDLRTLMAYHIASGRLSRSDAPERRDQSAPPFRPAPMMEEQALPCYVSY